MLHDSVSGGHFEIKISVMKNGRIVMAIFAQYNLNTCVAGVKMGEFLIRSIKLL